MVYKAKGEEVGGRGEAEYDLKAGSTSWLHPITVAFSPLVGERVVGHRGQGWWGIMESFMNFF